MSEPTAKPQPQRNLRTARVERIQDHNHDTRSLLLAVEGEPLRFIPGQFISISIPLADETRTRAYSIASDPEDGGHIEICFNRVAGGRGVEWLFARGTGSRLNFIGPFGAFTMERPPAAETILIAEGTAIAPIRPMIHRAVRAGAHAPMFLLYAAADREHLLYLPEFERAALRDPNFRFETFMAEPAALYERLHAEVQRRWVFADGDRTRHCYLCGVGKGVIHLRDLLRGAGYERRAVRYEQW